MSIDTFIAANKTSPVVKTELVSRQRGGAIFTLANNTTFQLDAVDLAQIPQGYPITKGSGDNIVEPPLDPAPVPVGIPDTEEDYSL